MKFLVFFRDDDWIWELHRAGGQVIATAVRGFRTPEEAYEAIEVFQKNCHAFIYDSAGNMVESIAITRRPKIVMR